MARSRWFSLVGLLLVLGSLEGCTVFGASWPFPQSHFDYPNSNITPLGRAQGEASTTSFFTPTLMDADLWEEAIQNALRQKGGDLLIDYALNIEIKMLWPYPPIYTTTFRTDGTAAKMEIGKQTLR